MSKKILSFTSNDVEISQITPVYRGFFTMQEYQFRHKCFNGEWSAMVKREIFERGGNFRGDVLSRLVSSRNFLDGGGGFRMLCCLDWSFHGIFGTTVVDF